MKIKQTSVFVENRSGRLAEITAAIAEAGCNILALSVADTTNFGILRFISDEPEKAEKALKDKGFTVSVSEVISVKIADEPGGLARLLSILAKEGITVEYMYAFINRTGNEAQVVMRIENEEKALKLIKESGFSA